MKKLCVALALLLTATSAHAGSSFSFKINGQSVRIDVPRNCDALACVSITAPGLKFSDPDPEPVEPSRAAPQAKTEPAAPSTTATTRPVDPPTSSAPAPQVSTLPPAANEQAAPPRQPELQAKPAQSNETTVATTAPAQDPIADAPAPSAAKPANSPLGTWMTEKKEGLVRIEPCGANICGYAVNAKTNQNGEKVLIDMRPSGTDKWTGRIHDTRNGGGGTYDSTVALRNPDQLRVTGCAFGGMFCGGQTWTRAN